MSVAEILSDESVYGEYPQGLELLVLLGDSKIAGLVPDFEKATPRQLLSVFGKLGSHRREANFRALKEEFEALGVFHIMWVKKGQVANTGVDFYAFHTSARTKKSGTRRRGRSRHFRFIRKGAKEQGRLSAW